MKKYLLYTLFGILLSSCSKQLIEKPKSFLSPSEFFQSDAEAVDAVNGAYSTCGFLYGGGGGTGDLGYWSSLGTGIAWPTAGRQSGFDFLTYTLGLSDEGSLDNTWKALYKGVANCNMVIGGVTNNSHIDQATSAVVLGQALFLRSLYYYWLTCYWGDVPMWLNPLDVSVVSGLSRAPVDSVRQQMVKDLKTAAADLPSVWTGADLGRASKWAADILLCHVYLWQKDWADAATVANEIMVNQGGNNRLLPSWGDIFGQANEYNAEDIWEIDFTSNTHPTVYTDRFMPRQADEPVVPGYTMTGYGLVTSTASFLATFDSGDLREPWYDWHGANGVTTHYHYVYKEMDWGEARSNSGLNVIVYRMADAYLMYAEAANELGGPTPEAYAAINAIRERAGLPDLAGLTQAEFRQAVRTERLHELSFEFNRRWDLNRWGTLVQAVQSDSATNPEGAANVRAYDTLSPVPYQEINLNPKLTQNPGY